MVRGTANPHNSPAHTIAPGTLLSMVGSSWAHNTGGPKTRKTELIAQSPGWSGSCGSVELGSCASRVSWCERVALCAPPAGWSGSCGSAPATAAARAATARSASCGGSAPRGRRWTRQGPAKGQGLRLRTWNGRCCCTGQPAVPDQRSACAPTGRPRSAHLNLPPLPCRPRFLLRSIQAGQPHPVHAAHAHAALLALGAARPLRGRLHPRRALLRLGVSGRAVQGAVPRRPGKQLVLRELQHALFISGLCWYLAAVLGANWRHLCSGV